MLQEGSFTHQAALFGINGTDGLNAFENFQNEDSWGEILMAATAPLRGCIVTT